MGTLRLEIFTAPLISALVLSSCIQQPVETEPPASSVPVGDVVPNIQYPDVYLVSQGFGFNLPQGWTGAMDPTRQTIRFTRPPFVLTLFYAGFQGTPTTLITGIGTDAGTIEIDAFWNNTVIEKFRLAGSTETIDLVVYFAQDPLNDIWLTAYLECLGDGCDDGITAAIEAQADWLLASYEEHGWEE